jgi:hypothetical protein
LRDQLVSDEQAFPIMLLERFVVVQRESAAR